MSKGSEKTGWTLKHKTRVGDEKEREREMSSRWWWRPTNEESENSGGKASEGGKG